MRNKLTAMGGPDGGDGGRGAHIVLRGNSNLWTLLHLRYFKNVLAEDGEKGGANNCHGRNGFASPGRQARFPMNGRLMKPSGSGR